MTAKMNGGVKLGPKVYGKSIILCGKLLLYPDCHEKGCRYAQGASLRIADQQSKYPLRIEFSRLKVDNVK